MIAPLPEIYILWVGLACYAIGAVVSWQNTIAWDRRETAVLAALSAGLLLLAAAIAQRWMRLGHGPFFNMFEILASNLFSLGLIYALFYWRLPRIRPTARIVLPILLVMALWLFSDRRNPWKIPVLPALRRPRICSTHLPNSTKN